MFTGYWAAYYNNTKNAKSPEKIVRQLLKDTEQSVDTIKKERPDVDVELFLKIERAFQKKLELNKWMRET